MAGTSKDMATLDFSKANGAGENGEVMTNGKEEIPSEMEVFNEQNLLIYIPSFIITMSGGRVVSVLTFKTKAVVSLNLVETANEKKNLPCS